MEKQRITLKAIKDAGLIPATLFVLVILGISVSGLIVLLEIRLDVDVPSWGGAMISSAVGVPILIAYLQKKLSEPKE